MASADPSLRDRAPGQRTLLVDALLGGVVSAVLAFVPLSPVIGGAVAGYLHRERGPRVGGLSGLFASVPVVLFVLLGLLVLGLGIVVPPGTDALGALVVFLLFVVLSALFVAGFNVVLGAVGGILGVALAEREERNRTEGERPAPASGSPSNRG